MALTLPLQLYVAIPLTSRFGEAFDTGPGAAALVASVYSAAYAAGFALLGPVCERAGRPAVMAAAAAVSVPAAALAAAAPDFGALLALRVVQGLAASAFPAAALAYVADHAPAARRPVVLAAVTTGLLAAGTVGQAYGQLVAEHTSWRAAFWPFAVLYAAAAFAFHRWRTPPVPGALPPPRTRYAEVGRLVARRGVVVVFATGATVFSSYVGLSAGLTRASGRDGLGPGGLLLAQACGVAALAAGPLAGRLLGGRGPRVLGVCGFVLSACGMLLATTGASGVTIAGYAVYVAGISVVVPALVGLLHELAPRARATAVGFHSCVLFAGASLGDTLAGHFEVQALARLFTALLLAAAAALALGGMSRTRPGR